MCMAYLYESRWSRIKKGIPYWRCHCCFWIRWTSSYRSCFLWTIHCCCRLPRPNPRWTPSSSTWLVGAVCAVFACWLCRRGESENSLFFIYRHRTILTNLWSFVGDVWVTRLFFFQSSRGFGFVTFSSVWAANWWSWFISSRNWHTHVDRVRFLSDDSTGSILLNDWLPRTASVHFDVILFKERRPFTSPGQNGLKNHSYR